jgi:hypothetical protein
MNRLFSYLHLGSGNIMQPDYSPNGHPNGSGDGSAKPAVKPAYQLTGDPIFYITVGFFAFMTTGVPGLMGQPNFMPIAQALGLTVFTAIPLRRGELKNAVMVVALWLGIQLLIMTAITMLAPLQASRAIAEGITYRMDLVTWAYTGDELPRSLLEAPLARLGEVVGVLLGSLLTGGLVGSWFLVRAVDLLGYSVGTLTREVVPALGLLLALTPWRLLTIAGYSGFFLLLAQPILTNHWQPAYYLKEQRRLILWSAGLLVAGLLLEALLPGLWQNLLEPPGP